MKSFHNSPRIQAEYVLDTAWHFLGVMAHEDEGLLCRQVGV